MCELQLHLLISCQLAYSHINILHIIVDCKQCTHWHKGETVSGQILKPVYFGKILNNKLNVTTEVLYDWVFKWEKYSVFSMWGHLAYCLMVSADLSVVDVIINLRRFGLAIAALLSHFTETTSVKRMQTQMTTNSEGLFWKAKFKQGVVKAKFLHEFVAGPAKRHTGQAWIHVTILSEEMRRASIKCVSARYKCLQLEGGDEKTWLILDKWAITWILTSPEYNEAYTSRFGRT